MNSAAHQKDFDFKRPHDLASSERWNGLRSS